VRCNPTTGLKECTKCKVAQPAENFSRDSKKVDGLKSACKECDRIYNSNRHYNNPSFRKEAHLRYRFGLSLEDVHAMRKHQHEKCAICLREFAKLSPQQIHIDHDHATGKIRGILCGKCNTGLGMFDDNPVSLYKAAEYAKS
jgi:hypothetical protein